MMSQASTTGEIVLSIGSRFENIELVQAMVDDSLDKVAIDEDSRYWIGIAVREAVANAIKHGNQQDPDKKVRVKMLIDSSEMVITISDEGEGFQPEEVENPLDPENLLKPSGRGIFYMKKFMDDLCYSFGPEGGTTVTLRKALEPGDDAAKENEE